MTVPMPDPGADLGPDEPRMDTGDSVPTGQELATLRDAVLVAGLDGDSEVAANLAALRNWVALPGESYGATPER